MKTLWKHGYHCVWAGDIEPRVKLVPGTSSQRVQTFDALKLSYIEHEQADCIITNPPWSREVLHPLIIECVGVAPTWLLIDADWVHTKQAALFTPMLRKVVSVGRVKWIPDSKMTGKDNCAWHLFDRSSMNEPTVFYGRAAE